MLDKKSIPVNITDDFNHNIKSLETLMNLQGRILQFNCESAYGHEWQGECDVNIPNASFYNQKESEKQHHPWVCL